jgi:demethylmenaquinone methyltransferase/2-methoxy-6-polyprenyl-1,4-benzoquinol methylase
VKTANESDRAAILPVNRTRQQTRRFYDRISNAYGRLVEPFERRDTRRALDRLAPRPCETVLEIGPGPGRALARLAGLVNAEGGVWAVDISSGMLRQARRHVAKASTTSPVTLLCGDAVRLPFADGSFDAAFMSFTLELFDATEIPIVLAEARRVLKSGGRLVVLGTTKEGGRSLLLRLYEWAHARWPAFVYGRPIYVERSLREAQFAIGLSERVTPFGLPAEIVLAIKPDGA